MRIAGLPGLLSGMLAAVMVLAGCDLFVSADGRVERAQEDVARGDYPAAVIELKNALEKDSAHVGARLLLAKVSLHLGDARTAEKELRRAREAGASATQLAELTAEVRLALGQARELLAEIDSRGIELEAAARFLYRGEALLALGRADEAAEAFDRAQAANRASARATIGRARALAAQRQAVEALTLLEGIPPDSPDHVSAQMARGQILAAQGRFGEARAALQGVLSGRGALPVIQQASLVSTLIESELASGDIEAARKSIQVLAGMAPNAPLTLLLAARIAMADQDYGTATASLQRVAIAMPDFVPARLLLGAALLAQGNLNQAEAHLSRVVQLAPENLEARKLLAQVRLRAGRPDAVIELLGPLQGNSDTDVNRLIGLAHMQLGESGQALSFLERIAAADGSNRSRQLELAAGYLQAREYSKALALLRRMPHVDGESRRDILLIAAVAASEGFTAGDREMSALIAAHPKDVALLNAASIYLGQRGEFERARGLLGRALATKPDDVDTLLNSARLEVAAADIATAAARLQGILALQPDHVAARMGLAELAMRENDLRGAAKALEPILEKDSSAIPPRLALARIYLLDRRTADATQVFAQLDKLAQGNAAVANATGLLFLEAGRYDEASARFERAIAQDSNNEQYWLNQARAQLALDRRVLARQSLDRARAMNPESVSVVATLAMLDVREGRPAAGAQRIASLRKSRPNDPSLLALEGDFHAAIRDYESASRAFDAALKLRPSAAISIRAYAARRDGKLRDATAPLEAWIARKPDDFMVQALLAEAYVSGGQRRRARDRYEFIIENGPPNAIVLNNLAWLYYELDDDRAEATAARAHELDPHNPAIADTYGWILVERGKVADGLKVLAQAEARGDQEIKYHYAAALARSGDADGARRRLKSLVESSESFNSQGDARRLMQELSTR